MALNSENALVPTDLVYNGAVIHQRSEMLSLTDMWKAQGSDAARQPANWLLSSEAKHFIAVLNPGNSGVMAKKGKNGGTYAHWQIAMAYAKYLSPKFHMWCNTVVRERMEGRQSGALVLTDEMRSVVGGIVKAVVVKALTETIPDLVRAEIATQQYGVVRGLTAGAVIDMAGVKDRKGLRGLASVVSSHLRRYHALKGVTVNMGSLGANTAYMFDPATSREWLLDAGGRSLIMGRVADKRRGPDLFTASNDNNVVSLTGHRMVKEVRKTWGDIVASEVATAIGLAA